MNTAASCMKMQNEERDSMEETTSITPDRIAPGNLLIFICSWKSLRQKELLTMMPTCQTLITLRSGVADQKDLRESPALPMKNWYWPGGNRRSILHRTVTTVSGLSILPSWVGVTASTTRAWNQIIRIFWDFNPDTFTCTDNPHLSMRYILFFICELFVE